jgi:LmbE family N-acetylglucosaminyl deacetylase
MLNLSLQPVRRVLCLGAHSDDIEIGAGGTLLKLIEKNPDLKVCWVVFNAERTRSEEAQESAKEYLAPLKKGYQLPGRTDTKTTGFYPI